MASMSSTALQTEESDFCVAYCFLPLESRDDGIHGVEAFHIDWKTVQDNCQHWEGGSSEFLGH